MQTVWLVLASVVAALNLRLIVPAILARFGLLRLQHPHPTTARVSRV